MSFLLDPALLIASGVGIGALAPDETSATVAEAGTMALFWGVSVSLWQDRPWIRWAPPLLGAESGRDFMLNSGTLNCAIPLHFDPAKRGRGRDLAAAAVFATYPLWLHLGRRLGRALRRRALAPRGTGTEAVAAPDPDSGATAPLPRESVT